MRGCMHACVPPLRASPARRAAGSTYSPEGLVLGPGGVVLRAPADSACLSAVAACSALCNDSALVHNADKGEAKKGGACGT